MYYKYGVVVIDLELGMFLEYSRIGLLVSRSQTLTLFYMGRKSRVWSTYVELFVLLTQPAGYILIGVNRNCVHRPSGNENAHRRKRVCLCSFHWNDHARSSWF